MFADPCGDRVVGERPPGENLDVSGPVGQAIRVHVLLGVGPPTPTGRGEFVVHELGPTGLVLLLGDK
jgi:hypothetical protein